MQQRIHSLKPALCVPSSIMRTRLDRQIQLPPWRFCCQAAAVAFLVLRP